MPQYQDRFFLRTAADRYLNKFLYLKLCHPESVLVPTYDIDCIWHAHMLHPQQYAEETPALCGQLVPHDDSLNDRCHGGHLEQQWIMTQRAWKDEFGEDGPDIRGGMFRGIATLEERQQKQQQEQTLQICAGGSFNIARGDNYAFLPDHHISWLHRQGLRLDECSRRFSCARDLAAQVVHGTANGRRRSFMEVVRLGTSCPLVTAHTADLPARKQLSLFSGCPSLAESEQALILRVASEDVGVLVGHWKKFSGLREVPGHLVVKLFSLKRMRSVRVRSLGQEQPSVPPTFHIPLGELGVAGCTALAEIDLAKAEVRGISTGAESAVSYGFALALAMLHVSVQPRIGVRPDPPEARDAPRSRDAHGPFVYPELTLEHQRFDMLRAAGGQGFSGYQYDAPEGTEGMGGSESADAGGCGACGTGGGHLGQTWKSNVFEFFAGGPKIIRV